MFEQATLSGGAPAGRAFAAGLGFAGQAALVGMVVLAPIIWPEVLPRPQALMPLLAPPVPVAPVVKTPVARPRAVQTAYSPIEMTRLVTPTRIPPKAATIEDPPQAPVISGALTGSQTADSAGLLTSLFAPTAAAPPARPIEKKAEPTSAGGEVARIKVSGGVQLARLIHEVQPEYPAVARATRTSGTVELTGIIGVDGRIRELRVVSGNPLLTRSALDAVRQWIYKPTLLNGQAVEVIAPITVTFRLN